MNTQHTLTDIEYSNRKKKTKREEFPDATTPLKFRHMLEKNKIGEKIFADVNERLNKCG